MSNFCGATDTPVLDFWWHLPWVSKPGWIPCFCASSPAHNGFLRFTSGPTPADLLTVSITNTFLNLRGRPILYVPIVILFYQKNSKLSLTFSKSYPAVTIQKCLHFKQIWTWTLEIQWFYNLNTWDSVILQQACNNLTRSLKYFCHDPNSIVTIVEINKNWSILYLLIITHFSRNNIYYAF